MSMRTDQFQGDGQTQTFTLGMKPIGSVQCSVNGMIQDITTFSVREKQATTQFVPQVGDLVAFIYDVTAPPPLALPNVVTVTPLETAKQFRGNFPAFADPGVYPDASINYWLAAAKILLNAQRFRSALQLATEMFVAHNLVLEAEAVQTAENGGLPGESRGPVSSESAGQVSINYDTASAVEENAGHWNTTVYGKRFIRMCRLFGMGPITVGPGVPGPSGYVAGSSASAGGWSGPSCLPGWFGS